MAIFSFSKLALSLIALFLAYRAYWEVTTGAKRRALQKKHGCLPPKKWQAWDPVLGLDRIYALRKAFHEHRLLEWWTKGFSDTKAHTVVACIMGQKIFLTDDPENVKTVLATNFDAWSLGQDRIDQMTSYLGKGIFTTEGAAWKHSREMLRPCFERSQVADVSIMEKHTNRLIERIPKDGTTIDLQPVFQNFTLDVATEFLFGQSTNSLDTERTDEDAEKFVEAFEYCQNPHENEKSKKWGLIGAFLPDPKFKKCAKVIEEFADKIIDKEAALKASESSKSSPSNRYVFLDELLSVTEDRTAIRSELLNILLAGRDTTASLLSNIFFELPRHPEILARLRREITEFVGDESPNYQQLKNMKYLKAIINETQRLYPIVSINSRQALQDTVLPYGGGPSGTAPILVPKGAYISYHHYTMHRRKDIFGPDAENFDPTRWLDNEHSSSPLRPGWGYLPFSGGPRICIGQQFALTEASYVVVRLLQAFKVLESRDPEPWREKLSLVCSGFGGCKVGLKA